MDTNIALVVAACLLAAGLAYGISNFEFEEDDKKVILATSGTKAEDIGSSRTGDLYPSEKYWLKCERKWKDNWTMRDYCESQQADAKQWASTTVVDDDIAVHCTRKWPDDWVMFKYCANQQMQAKLNVKSRH